MPEVLYHVSFQTIEEFKLRVPDGRMVYEDDSTPRICLSTDIQRCINAMPEGGRSLQGLLKGCKKLDMPAVVHVYRCFPKDEPEEIFIMPETLMMCHGVIDAEAHWAVKIPKMTHMTIAVVNAEFREFTDPLGNNGVYVDQFEYDSCKEQFNWAEEMLKNKPLDTKNASARDVLNLYDEMYD